MNTEAGKVDRLSDLQYPDMYNYLINSPLPYTREFLGSYKSIGGIQMDTILATSAVSKSGV